MKTFIPFSQPLIGREEISEVVHTLKSGWITTGAKVSKFETQFEKYLTAPHAVACSSATDALLIALDVMGVNKGDEVIIPTMTFTATAQAVLHRGAKPVFADIDRDTLNISVDDIERKITQRTKGIIPVHYGGNPCDMTAIFRIARKHKLAVIEDAAHAIGSKYKGRNIGTLSAVTCFSFYATKNITTTEGGMMTLRNKSWAARARRLTIHGISDGRRIWGERFKPKGSWDYDVVELGYKANMTDMQAGIGIHQLKRLNGFIKTRGMYVDVYRKALEKIPGVGLQKIRKYNKTSHHLFPVLLPENISRDRVIRDMHGEGIGTSVLWRPLHMHTFYKNKYKFRPGVFPVASDVFSRLINIPVSPSISLKDVKRIAKSLSDIIG